LFASLTPGPSTVSGEFVELRGPGDGALDGLRPARLRVPGSRRGTTPNSELLSVERFGENSPPVAVEVKAHIGAGTVDVERGILQAYDRLHEANAAYAAAPAGAITESKRTLARELNAGPLGVSPDGEVTPLKVQRVVGNLTSDSVTSIRVQTTTQGVADRSFGLVHPRNCLAYPLAVHHSGDTETLVADHAVGAVDGARSGAVFLGLVTDRTDRVVLTPLGGEVVRFAAGRYDSIDSALRAFEPWKRSQKRFCDAAEAWGQVTRRVVWAYPATKLLVEELQTMHDDGLADPSLADLVEWLHVQHPAFTVELFIRGTDDARRRVLNADGDLQPGALADGSVFHAPTVFQLKTMLFHAGLLADRGTEPHRLDPPTDSWRLRTPL